MQVNQTVREWISSLCSHGTSEFDDQIRTYGDLKIVKHYDGTTHGFPQLPKRYCNVYSWVLLEDGTSVGWNESPRNGWSFPRTGKSITKQYLDFFQERGI